MVFRPWNNISSSCRVLATTTSLQTYIVTSCIIHKSRPEVAKAKLSIHTFLKLFYSLHHPPWFAPQAHFIFHLTCQAHLNQNWCGTRDISKLIFLQHIINLTWKMIRWINKVYSGKNAYIFHVKVSKNEAFYICNAFWCNKVVFLVLALFKKCKSFVSDRSSMTYIHFNISLIYSSLI